MAAAVMLLLQVQLALGANSRVEKKGERGEGGSIGGDVWASPGATGTHTLPLAFPGDRPTYLRG